MLAIIFPLLFRKPSGISALTHPFLHDGSSSVHYTFPILRFRVNLIGKSPMRRLLIALLVGFLVFATPPSGEAAGQLSLFQTEEAAQQHCPRDVVVWLNLPSGIYHFKSQRWYARTKSGAFVCKTEADQAGDRASLNGQ